MRPSGRHFEFHAQFLAFELLVLLRGINGFRAHCYVYILPVEADSQAIAHIPYKSSP